MSDGFSWIVNSDFALKQFIEFVTQHYQQHRHVTFTWQVGRQRSKKQNAALHVWLKELSKQLNEAGYDMKKTLKPEVEIPWDDQGIMAKEHLWRPVQRIMLEKESTIEPEKMEYTKVYETLNRHLSTKFGISIPWPQHENK